MTNIKGASATKSIPRMPVDIGGMTFKKMGGNLYHKVLKKAFK
ncbi:MAG: hypothetical protein ACI9CU_002428 [Polaribacter sp.]|jgi:hypothetical protein